MEETEYRVPVKLLTKREPIFFNRLSALETAQWVVVGAFTYFCMNALPLGLAFKVGLLGAILMIGGFFIHIPFNGLTGLEWLFIALRFRVEEEQHQAAAPNILSLPTFTLTYSASIEEIGFEGFDQPDFSLDQSELNQVIQPELETEPQIQPEPNPIQLSQLEPDLHPIPVVELELKLAQAIRGEN